MKIFDNIPQDTKNNIVNLFLEETGIKTKKNHDSVYYYDGEYNGIEEKDVLTNPLFLEYCSRYWVDKVRMYLSKKEEEILNYALMKDGKGLTTQTEINLIINRVVKDENDVIGTMKKVYPFLKSLQETAMDIADKAILGEVIWDDIIEFQKIKLPTDDNIGFNDTEVKKIARYKKEPRP